MVIDSHGHVTAPDSLYVYKAQILAHRGAHGRGGNLAVDDDVKEALNSPVFGGSSHLQQLKEVGTDLQLISPRPYQMMTSENPRLMWRSLRARHGPGAPGRSRHASCRSEAPPATVTATAAASPRNGP